MKPSAPKDKNFGFSERELDLVLDTGFFTRKNDVLLKILEGFAGLEQQLSDIQLLNIPQEARINKGKISQGEKYLGAPWMVLDVPAFFSGKDIFAFRHMFLWGKCFTSSLHVSGRFLSCLSAAKMEMLSGKNYFMLTGPDPFVHHYDPNIYIPINEINLENILNQGFFRISTFKPLNEADSFQLECVKFVKKMDELMMDQ